MLYIERVYNTVPNEQRVTYPYNVPSLKGWEELRFSKPVTFVVGENGMGKSTLIEGVAVSCGFNPEGGSIHFNFATKNSHSDLFQYLKLSRGVRRNKDGYFLRAESFYNVASVIDEVQYASSYGGSLHEKSHGESFLALLHQRLKGKGLYIFDEPEAALSVHSQLNMLARIGELVAVESQFIIATHSPILLAYPGAEILQVTESGLARVSYEDSEPFVNTKLFINHYKQLLSAIGLSENS